ncbi:MAG TPA: class 1 fructose-bisphosphatase [Methylomirabilota bacterium]|nr:class 1 fructose-bisphosphatase [Methylomirabilota bacterium]
MKSGKFSGVNCVSSTLQDRIHATPASEIKTEATPPPAEKMKPSIDPNIAAMIQEMTRINLRAHLSNNEVEDVLRKLIAHLADSAKYISFLMGLVKRTHAGTSNIFGEQQMQLDVFADEVLRQRLADESSFGVAEFASEEQGHILILRNNGEEYSITVDPLDGSSRIRANGTVGTIIGIHRRPIISQRPARASMVGAMYVVYGPLTTLVYSVGKGVHEFVLDQAGNFLLSTENITMPEKGSLYSPGGQRSEWNPTHAAFISQLEERGYKLRYSGALVPDFHQLLLEGGGIFSYPALKKAANGKLRLLFEAQPLAFIAEQAGGAATNGEVDILDFAATDLDQRCPFYIGSKHEVAEAARFFAADRWTSIQNRAAVAA